jgi:hypothetical protein
MLHSILDGFYTKLATWSGTYKTYQILAPQNATLPYVVFGLETDIPIGTFADSTAIESLTFWINVFSSISPGDVTTQADAVLGVLDNSTLTVTSYSSMVCKREFIGSTIYDPQTGVYQVPLRYRVMIDKN